MIVLSHFWPLLKRQLEQKQKKCFKPKNKAVFLNPFYPLLVSHITRKTCIQIIFLILENFLCPTGMEKKCIWKSIKFSKFNFSQENWKVEWKIKEVRLNAVFFLQTIIPIIKAAICFCEKGVFFATSWPYSFISL